MKRLLKIKVGLFTHDIFNRYDLVYYNLFYKYFLIHDCTYCSSIFHTLRVYYKHSQNTRCYWRKCLSRVLYPKCIYYDKVLINLNHIIGVVQFRSKPFFLSHLLMGGIFNFKKSNLCNTFLLLISRNKKKRQ